MERPKMEPQDVFDYALRSVLCLIRVGAEIHLARLVVQSEDGEEIDVWWEMDGRDAYRLAVGEVSGWIEVPSLLGDAPQWRGTSQCFELAQSKAMYSLWHRDDAERVQFAGPSTMMPRGLPVDVLGKRLDGRLMVAASQDGVQYRALMTWADLFPS